MPVSKKRKGAKKHRKLNVRLNPEAMLRDHSTETLSMAQVRSLLIHAHASLVAIQTGEGKEVDITNLAVGSNIALIFAERGLGEDHIAEIKAAQKRIVGLQRQWRDRGTAILSGPGMLEIRRFLEIHDEQVQHEQFTEANVRQALRIIHGRMKAGDVEVPE